MSSYDIVYLICSSSRYRETYFCTTTSCIWYVLPRVKEKRIFVLWHRVFGMFFLTLQRNVLFYYDIVILICSSSRIAVTSALILKEARFSTTSVPTNQNAAYCNAHGKLHGRSAYCKVSYLYISNCWHFDTSRRVQYSFPRITTRISIHEY